MSGGYDVQFAVPDVFVPLDLGKDAVARVESLMARTPDLADEHRFRLAVSQEVLVETLRSARIGYAATSLVRVDGSPPRLSIAQFTVATRPTSAGARSILESVAADKSAARPGSAVGFLNLTAGRALAIVEERRFTTSTDPLGRPRSRDHVVRQVQLLLPFPGDRYLATFALTTESVADAGAYLDLMGAIARSITFVMAAGHPADGGSIAAALNGDDVAMRKKGEWRCS